MKRYIDVDHFVRSSGSRALLALVCQAFLDQLPRWRLDFTAANESGDRQELAELLHKMKGCCYAVAAIEAALNFQKAEKGLTAIVPGLPWAEVSAQLLAVLVDVEQEMLAHAAPSAEMPAAPASPKKHVSNRQAAKL